jgi:hypothetical protein
LANIKFQIQGEKEILALLERLPKLIVSAGGPLDRAVTKAAAIVAAKSKQLAPDSRKNPKGDSRKKQSKKSKAIWTGKLKTTVRKRVIRYDTGVWAVVGPKNPEGNMAHFVQEKPRRMVLWGKATMIERYRDDRRWITRAFDETRGQQISAAVESLRFDIDANMRS